MTSTLCQACTFPHSYRNHTHTEHHRHVSYYSKLLYIPQIYTKSMCQLTLHYHNMKRSIINNNFLWEASYTSVTQITYKPVPSWSLGAIPCVFLKTDFVFSLTNLRNRFFSDRLATTCHYGQSIRTFAMCPHCHFKGVLLVPRNQHHGHTDFLKLHFVYADPLCLLFEKQSVSDCCVVKSCSSDTQR